MIAEAPSQAWRAWLPALTTAVAMGKPKTNDAHKRSEAGGFGRPP
jgi:hypothetical protein